LGLSISSTLIANDGGKLRPVKSDAGGSTFELAMPVGKQRGDA
jgi:K+-sensing histidine kinase KdpD